MQAGHEVRVMIFTSAFSSRSHSMTAQNLLAWLQKEVPDIACLQELKSVDAGFRSMKSTAMA